MPQTYPSVKERSPLSKDPMLRMTAAGILLLLVAFIAARAPTSFKGKLPFVDEFIPLDLNVVYLIVLGPIAATCLAAYLWYLASERTTHEETGARKDSGWVAVCFAIFALLTAVLSSQYFIVLAPEELCGTIPHFDFLWTNVPGMNRIHHCMSGTKALNASSPFYLQPQILQSWGHVLWPALTAYCLHRAWRRWAPAG